MTSTASPILRLELMGSGDQAGTWGTTTNTNLGTLLEGSIAGASTVSVTATPQALTAVNYATDQSRMAIIILTTTTAANFTVYAPPVSKTYVVWNNTSYTATIGNATAANGTTPTGGATVTLAAGEKVYIFSDGSNFYRASPATLSLSLGTAAAPSLSFVSDADTGIYSSGANQVSVTTSGARIANFTTSTLDLYTTDVTYGPQVTLNSIHSAVPGPYFIANKARNNGSGSAAIVQSGDTLGVLSFNGYDGTAYRNAVQIAASVDTTPGANDMPGRLSIYVTPDGSTTPAERLTIINSGFVGIGTSAPVNRLDVNGRGAFTQDAAASNGAVILRQNSGDTIGAYIQWVNNAASAEKGWITVDTSSNMKFATGSTLRLTIDSSGAATFTGALSTQSTLSVGAAGATATVSGSAPLFMCRAWVSFSANGGTITVNGSGNVTSVTYNGAGDYTINFTTALPNANYAVSGVCANWNGGQSLNVGVQYGNGGVFGTTTPSLKTTTQLRVVVGVGNSAAGIDGPEVNVMVFA